MYTEFTSPILGLRMFRPYVFRDKRGEYTETYNSNDVMRGFMFVQDSAIVSKMGVLRGYHGDARTTKLVTCLQGVFQIVVVCIDPLDNLYMKPETFVLDAIDRVSLVIPPRYVNAHQCLSDTCLFFYKQNTYYLGEGHQYTIGYDTIPGVEWPLTPILSNRDSHANNAAYYHNIIEGGVRRLVSPEERYT